MVDHRNARNNDVCKGGTVADQINAMNYDHEPKEGRAGYRQLPNSDSMGYLAGLQTQGKLTHELAAEFMAEKREAGCITIAKVAHDGSIEFTARPH